VLGDIFHNPVLQNRLASYPPLLPIADRSEFKDVGNDVKFQTFWLADPSFNEFKGHPKVAPLLDNGELYNSVTAALKNDYKDLQTYLETGKSEKYGEEKIVGRWEFDRDASMVHARKAKPNITTVELRWLRRSLTVLNNANFVAFLDNKARLKLPSTNSVQTLQGTWKATTGNSYVLSFTEGKRQAEFPATLEGNRLAISKDNLTLIFDK
jgi:hypothetical protein